MMVLRQISLMVWVTAGVIALGVGASQATAGEMYRQFESPRGLAMGGALTTVAKGVDALLYNPAGLVQETNWKLEGRAWRERSLDDSGRSSIGFFDRMSSVSGRPLGDGKNFLETDGAQAYSKRQLSTLGFHTSAGFGVVKLGSEGLYYTPELGGAEPRFNLRYEKLDGYIMGFSYTTRWRLFSWGMSLKHFKRTLEQRNLAASDLVNNNFTLTSDMEPGSDHSWDAGILWRLPVAFLGPSLSATVLNVSPMDFRDPAAPKLEREINLGFSAQPQLMKNVRVLLTADIRDFERSAYPDDIGSKRREHLGTEISILPTSPENYMVHMRTGLSQGFFSFGFGVNLGQFIVINFADYYEDIGDLNVQKPRRRQVLEAQVGF